MTGFPLLCLDSTPFCLFPICHCVNLYLLSDYKTADLQPHSILQLPLFKESICNSMSVSVYWGLSLSLSLCFCPDTNTLIFSQLSLSHSQTMGCIFSRHLLHVYGERNFIHNQYLHTVEPSTALLETCFAVIVIAFQVQVLKLSAVISYQEWKL